MTLSEYSLLKDYIIYAVGTNERHSIILSSLKELFRETINSVRRFEQINSIGHLLKVLEIRDLLSEDNVECLKSIALQLPNSIEVLKKITDYENSHVHREYSNYYTPSATQQIKKESERSYITCSPQTTTLSDRKKQRIFKTIINEIGSSWRDLGRNLNVRECDIDNIDFQNKTVHVKATELLKIYEYEIADPQRWFFVLCDALEKSRRKELARSLQNIMAMNI